MKTKMKLLLAALFCTGMVSAQVNLGTLKGKFVSEESEVIPSTKVIIEGKGKQLKTVADFNGKFDFVDIEPGIYTMMAYAFGKDTIRYDKIEVLPNSITDLDAITMMEKSIEGDVVVITYKPGLIDQDLNKIHIPLSDIENSPNIRNPKELFASYNSDIIILEGTSDMIIRGSRPGDVIYYVDGVKTTDLNGVPGVGIGSMTGYTGGVPAKYGDTTGGVVVLETKSYFDLYYAWLAGQ